MTLTEWGRLKVTTILLELLVGFSSVKSWWSCFLGGKLIIFKGKINFTKRAYLGSKLKFCVLKLKFCVLHGTEGRSIGSTDDRWFSSSGVQQRLKTGLNTSSLVPRAISFIPGEPQALFSPFLGGSTSYWSLPTSSPLWFPSPAFSSCLGLGDCKGKNCIVSVYIIHNTLWILLNSDTRYMGFPNIKQFCDTSWVSCHLIQFWRYLPGASVRPHRLSAQSNETAPSHHFGCQPQIQVVTCASDFRSEFPTTLSSGFD